MKEAQFHAFSTLETSPNFQIWKGVSIPQIVEIRTYVGDNGEERSA